MNELIIPEVVSDLEKNEFEFHITEIINAVNERNMATGKIIQHVDEVIRKDLWKGHYDSAEDFVRSVLKYEHMSSYNRVAKSNRMFLYLNENASDENEQATLSLMREPAYRELRRISIGESSEIMRKGSESSEEYETRRLEKEIEDFTVIKDLWSRIYPHLRFHYEEQNKVLPNGAISISAKDITLSAKVIQQSYEAIEAVKNGEDPFNVSITDIGGADISLGQVLEEAQEYSSEAIHALERIGISVELTEKTKRQNEHMRQRLEEVYVWDTYEGVVNYDQFGRLIIENDNVKYDIAKELGDLVNQHTRITVRRPNKS